MCQETLEIVLDQVSHLCPGVDSSAITSKTRWDPKGKRIYVPEELLGDGAEVPETLPGVVPEQQQEQGNTTVDSSLFVLALCRLVLLHFWHSVMPFARRDVFNFDYRFA
ncbi:hypothetical protein PIB30_010060 [Stylosanthes scabra]|uniref:Uncharacterized protein n=1 Tax=Stylosanthes scabra TaxID=79078 RepID=A0ABU6X3K1_9FABA|nr:hypothetical protein [Stylosanthes scabra]